MAVPLMAGLRSRRVLGELDADGGPAGMLVLEDGCRDAGRWTRGIVAGIAVGVAARCRISDSGSWIPACAGESNALDALSIGALDAGFQMSDGFCRQFWLRRDLEHRNRRNCLIHLHHQTMTEHQPKEEERN